jgi:hypothetical protein
METTMRSRIHVLVLALLAGSTLATAAPSFAAPAPQQRNDRYDRYDRRDQRAYDQGFEQGVREGERDARRSGVYDLNLPNRRGQQGADFDSGFADGYRAGFQRVRPNDRRDNRSDNRVYRNGQIFGGSPSNGAYREPASARGYSDGYERGLDDAKHHNRYDPVGEKDYRDGDEGYNSSYGSKDAYKNNYRTGFRQGYEDGYRGAARR